jgi:hypothetical protein
MLHLCWGKVSIYIGPRAVKNLAVASVLKNMCLEINSVASSVKKIWNSDKSLVLSEVSTIIHIPSFYVFVIYSGT